MAILGYCLQSVLLLLTGICSVACSQPPNIILIVSDDLGYNDVSYHGSKLIKTPAIDKLAADGIRLENYYVQPICTPSRSQLLSGRYQIHTGLQHEVIQPCQRSGLPLEDKTLADKLKEQDYMTHMVGKWHLGMYREEYTPTRRGFDSFFGYLSGAEDHFTHYMSTRGNTISGLDFHDNLEPYNQSYGEYSTPIFTRRAQTIIESHDKSKPLFLYLPFQNVHAPLQVPAAYERKFVNIQTQSRRIFAGMAAAMDEGIHNITETLKSAGIWNNTLIVFTNDNGGMVVGDGGGNNAPFRGSKYTYFEGGIKGVGFVSGPVIKTAGVVNHQLMHVSDWFPTLINLAGGSLIGTKPDGYDMWSSIVNNKTSPRDEIIYNIDPRTKSHAKSMSDVFDTSVQAALRYGDYKIMTGPIGGFSGWAPEPTMHLNQEPIKTTTDSADQNVYLFNIAKDPEERHDLSQSEPKIVSMMLERLAKWNTTAVPVHYPHDDLKCNPALHGGVWGPWV